MKLDLAALVERLLDKAQENDSNDSFDLIADYESPIPVEVVSNMLDVPYADRSTFRDWSLAILGALEPVTPADVLARGNTTISKFSSYPLGLIEDRRQNPAQYEDGVMGRLSALITMQIFSLMKNPEKEKRIIFTIEI